MTFCAPEEVLATLADEEYVGHHVLASVPDLQDWMRATILRFSDESLTVQGWREGDEIRINLYSRTHVYGIRARQPEVEEYDGGYLGCVGWSQLCEPGEVHRRGHDLHDGPYTRATWDRIVADIAAFELVHLSQHASRGNPNLL